MESLARLKRLDTLCKKWENLNKSNPTSQEIPTTLILINDTVEKLLPEYGTKEAVKDAVRKLRSEKKTEKNKKTKTCRRCNGTGMYANNLVCFGCGGSGSALTKYGMTQRLWKERIEMYQSGEYDRTIKILNEDAVNKEAEMNNTNHEGLKNHYRKQLDEIKNTIAKKIADKAEFDEDFAKYGNGDFPTKLLNIKFNTAIL